MLWSIEDSYHLIVSLEKIIMLLMTSCPVSPGPPLPSGTLTTLSPSLSTTCCENGRPILTDPHTGQNICSCQYGSGILSAYNRIQGLGDTMYSTPHYATQGYMPINTDTSAFYSSLNPAYYDNLKDTSAAETWLGITQPTACIPYNSSMAPYPYTNTYGGMDLNGAARRKNATRETANTLKAWLYEHRKNPYPTKGEKIMLAIITKMTLTQVSTWFANARRRLKKDNKMTWSPRNRCGDDEDDEVKNDHDGDSADDSKQDKTNPDTKDADLEGACEKPLYKAKNTKSWNSSYVSSPGDQLGLQGSLSPTPPPLKLNNTMVSEINNDLKRLNSPCSSSSDSGLSDINKSLSTNGSISDKSDPLRPRIWSLAHVATSTAGFVNPTADQKDQTSNIMQLKSIPSTMSMPTPSYTPTDNSMNMRPWLDSTLGSSIFSPIPGSYTIFGGQCPRESPSDMVNESPRESSLGMTNESLTSLNSLSSGTLSRPYASLSNFYNPIRELTPRHTDTMSGLRS